MNVELTGIPESLGTTKCYDCGTEPPEGTKFLGRFIEYDNKIVRVPCCHTCRFEIFNSGDLTVH